MLREQGRIQSFMHPMTITVHGSLENTGALRLESEGRADRAQVWAEGGAGDSQMAVRSVG